MTGSQTCPCHWCVCALVALSLFWPAPRVLPFLPFQPPFVRLYPPYDHVWTDHLFVRVFQDEVAEWKSEHLLLELYAYDYKHDSRSGWIDSHLFILILS